MAIVDIEMPKLGESIVEATILKWLKNPGDKVAMDETILEIATDKVDSEVPSTSDGVITEVLFSENDVVPVGTVIARIDTEGLGSAPSPSNMQSDESQNEPTPTPVQPTPPPAPQPSETTVQQPAVHTAPPAAPMKDRFYSPLVLKIATKEGIGMAELERVPGNGKNGRVTKKDILAYVQNRTATPVESSSSEQGLDAAPVTAVGATSAAGIAANGTNNSGTNTQNVVVSGAEISSTEIETNPGEEVIPMDRMRKLIADHMVNSVQTSPHVTSFSEADVTNLVAWRNNVKEDFQKKYGQKLTLTPLFIEAAVQCIKDFPMINSSIRGENIIIKKNINIGMATALPSGNLIVPVIKNADHKNLIGLSADVNDLANKARNNGLKPEDTQGGTFTITNVGTFGSLMGTPIINQPQVAIMALGTIAKRPMVMATESGDVVAIRQMMYLSLSYDHRIVDGALGASYLTAVAKKLESFDPNREI